MSPNTAKPGWVDYPPPVEGPNTPYVSQNGTNPVLRGTPLLLASRLFSSSSSVASYFWNNTGFGALKNMSVLNDVPYRFLPTVIPLRKESDEPILPFEDSLLQPRHTSSAFRYYSAADLQALYKAGTVTPTQVVESLLPLIKQGQSPKGLYEDGWLDSHGNEHRVAAAAKASTERWAAGKPLGPLDGIPIGVKDDTDIEGYINHFGIKHDDTLPFHVPSHETAWPIAKLQEAGAIVLGRNRMHELGSDTNGLNPFQGTPTNHLNNAYYPGGSSSGGGSALGAGVIPIAVGTDAGGSARIPPNYNGVYGLKTTQERLTKIPHLSCCVHCPMAATVQDLTLAYRIMAQPDPSRSNSSIFATSRPLPKGQTRYLGVYRDWWAEADPEVREVCERAIQHLTSKEGYEVVDITLPVLSEARTAHGLLCATELAETHRFRTKDLHRSSLSVCNSANRMLVSVGSVTPAKDYFNANAVRELVMRHLSFLFEKYPGLLIVTPVTPQAGWAKTKGDEAYGCSDTNMSLANMMYIWLANLTGTPAVTAPVGYVEPRQGKGKLNVSLMATGEWGSEEQLLEWAADTEDYLHEVYPEGKRRPDTWLDVIKLVKEGKV